MARGRILAITMLTSAVWMALGGTAAASRVTVSPTVSVTEGDSQMVQFQLDEPIIGPEPDADVTMNLTVDDPSRVSLSDDSLHWAAAEWPQVRTLTVTAEHDGVHDDNNNVIVHFTLTSASEYYSGYSNSFTVAITDIDPAPTTTTVPPATTVPTTSAPTTVPDASTTAPAASTTLGAVAPGELPRTGSSSESWLVIGTVLTFGGAGVMRAGGSRSRRRHAVER